MVAAYLRGRGGAQGVEDRDRSRAACAQGAGTALSKWERSSGDFKSTLELNTANSDARHNAEVLDLCIAKLVDSVRELQQSANGMGDKKQQLVTS